MIKLEADTAENYAVRLVATFGQNVRRAMEALGIEPKDLASALGVQQGTLSDWMRDRRGLPEGPTLIKFAKALETTVDDLIEGIDAEYDAVRRKRGRPVGTPPPPDSEIDEAVQVRAGDEVELVPFNPEYQKRGLPVLYEGEASPMGLSWSEDGTPLFHVEEWGSRPVDIKDPQAYLVVIRGDSMEPAYKRGWRAIVSPNIRVRDGDLVCVHLRTGERLIKTAHRVVEQNGWQLVSYNQAYPPRFATDAEVAMIHKVAYVRTMK